VEPEWFRAPYGVRWFGMGRAQRRLRLTGAMWSAIGRDWRLDSAATIRRLANGASNGAILCLHDGRELRARPDISVTVEVVRRLIPTLLEKGYRFETVSQLLCPTN
jgi:peptidoglycan-N-acetylglucosamine deacetylase